MRRKARRPDIALVPLPLFHVYACVGVQSHSIISRTPMALVPNPRDIADLLKTIKTVRPTLFSAVPALFIALLNHPKVKNKSVDFSSIRACFSGAAPLMAATKTQFEALTGGRIVEGYSLTEAMMACIVNPLNGINKVGSVGVPLPDIEVAIVDAESGTRFLPNGETGEIILRAPQLMAGYFNDVEETTRALRVHPSAPMGARHSTAGDDARPWLHTGDLGYLDADSFLFIVDRQKDLIKTSGYQVWPREVEEVLAAHPCVQDVGVAGVPDDVKGEVVKAWVVKRSGTNPTIEELRTYCKQNLAPYKTPAHVEFRDSLPKTMAGKVLRRELVAEHRASSRHPQAVKYQSHNAATVIPACSSPARTAAARSAAPGVSPCTQIVSTFTETVEPSRATTLPSRTIRTARSAARTGSDRTAPAIWRGVNDPSGSYARSANPSAATERPWCVPADSNSDPGSPTSRRSAST